MTEFNHDSLFDKIKSDVEAICNASIDEYKKSVASKLGSNDYTSKYGIVTDKSLDEVTDYCHDLFAACQKNIEDKGRYMIHFVHYNWRTSEYDDWLHDLCFAIDNYGDYIVVNEENPIKQQVISLQLNIYNKSIKKEKSKYSLPNILIDAVKNMEYSLIDDSLLARNVLAITITSFLTGICKIAKHYHMKFVRFEKLFKSDDFEKYDDVVSMLDGTTKELNEMQKRVIDLEFALSDMKKLLLEKDNEIARGCDKLKTIKDNYMKLIDSLEDV